MQKTITFFIIAIISVITFYGCANAKVEENYLRIHIRANSNVEIDQNIKYKIKDEVIEYLTPYIAECNNYNQVLNMLQNNLTNIVQKVNEVLEQNNFSYSSNAKINNEFFPTRSYDYLVLEANYYDALIIELGQAKGDNWWCVVYPPLCFLNGNNVLENNVVYKSKILELINKFF